MYKVKIFGAGSIGNHLANACRTKGWDVLICDKDPEALARTKNDIYPARYGAWDGNIKLSTVDECREEKFDLVIIGTPPEYHFPIAIDVLKKNQAKAILIEKPMCTPSLEGANEIVKLAKVTGTFVGVGYNHTLADNTVEVEKVLAKPVIGEALSLHVRWLEYWGGIFNAHPWLAGPHDSYLGFIERGGGACGEHSHCINIWQHIAHVLNKGKIKSVSAMMDIVDDGQVHYDRLTQLSVETESGFKGSIITDVLTEPAEKMFRVQGDKGFVEWFANYKPGNDALRYWDGTGDVHEQCIAKTRPDDFKGEIEHVGKIMEGTITESPISLERGLDTMLVIAAANVSAKNNRTVTINYNKGYSAEAIELTNLVK